MRLNDSHLHISSGIDDYDIDISFRNIIYNYIEEYNEESDKYRDSSTHHTLIFDFRSTHNTKFLIDEIKANRVHGIKIHSRIQKILPDEYDLLLKRLNEIPEYIPITFDAFYDGPDVMYQPSMTALGKLVEIYPNRKVIIAHSGGYEMLKYFFHFRTLKNVYFDLSLSLHYLKDSSVKTDLIKLLKFVNKERIIFGTDYPFAPASGQVDTLLSFFEELDISKDEQDLVFYQNYLSVFKS